MRNKLYIIAILTMFTKVNASNEIDLIGTPGEVAPTYKIALIKIVKGAVVLPEGVESNTMQGWDGNPLFNSGVPQSPAVSLDSWRSNVCVATGKPCSIGEAGGVVDLADFLPRSQSRSQDNDANYYGFGFEWSYPWQQVVQQPTVTSLVIPVQFESAQGGLVTLQAKRPNDNGVADDVTGLSNALVFSFGPESFANPDRIPVRTVLMTPTNWMGAPQPQPDPNTGQMPQWMTLQPVGEIGYTYAARALAAL